MSWFKGKKVCPGGVGAGQRTFFNMSRTLSIGNEGPRAVNLALGPVYLGRNSR